MNKYAFIGLLVFALGFHEVQAQNTNAKPAYQMINSMMVKPKRGMEKKFEQGVLAHIEQFHKSGPNRARLAVISEGFRSDGWYVWTMGPTTYTELDRAPQGEAKHDEDWDKNVDIYVEQYDENFLWKLQDEISYTPADYNPKNLDVWIIDLKPGMRFEFGELMKKWKTMFEQKKYPYSQRVFYNELWNRRGMDVSIAFSFDKYADFDLDIKFKEDYESIFGPGSHAAFWRSWNNCVENTTEHMRKFLN
ncbi:MAG TPA: hypothetical protein VFX48_09810 [Saprospiraceae bacterium]|nr:hypothetical protein [Saprospiraceae bacterium]